MNWGTRIFILYMAFALFMAGMVAVAMRQKDIFLVDKEYYKEELAYQAKIDKIRHAQRLSAPVSFSREAGQLRVQFPPDGLPDSGSLVFFRPSNALIDKHVAITTNNSGSQVIPLAGLAKGLWRVKLTWAHNAQTYYTEHELILQ